MNKRSKLVSEKAKVKSKVPSKKKGLLHPRNPHNGSYDFEQLTQASSELAPHVYETPRGRRSIDFSDPVAVKLLNQALLKVHYNIEFWDIPQGYLCPPIPGRADYLHYLADLLAESNRGKVPVGGKVCGLDIGTGANCIYPIIGSQTYGWHYIASDIDPLSLASAEEICQANRVLQGKIKFRRQSNERNIFKQVIKSNDRFDFTLCNPPFHASLKEAQAGSQRKVNNLSKASGRSAPDKFALNFGGQGAELWCKGGEITFVRQMIKESQLFAKNCLWFTTLISKKDNLPAVYQTLKQAGAVNVKTVEMAQGQKVSRFVAWSFLSVSEQEAWFSV